MKLRDTSRVRLSASLNMISSSSAFFFFLQFRDYSFLAFITNIAPQRMFRGLGASAERCRKLPVILAEISILLIGDIFDMLFYLYKGYLMLTMLKNLFKTLSLSTSS